MPNEVKRLIAGPGVYICDECIALCSDILRAQVERAPVARMAVPSAEQLWSGEASTESPSAPPGVD